MRTPLLLSLLLGITVCSAQYNGPESVEYDAVGDRYFVSNTGSGFIKVRDQAGVVADFVTVAPAPYGLEIMGDTLFACSGGSVKGYRLSDATMVFNRNLGGSFLNGITTDGRFLYVTDFSATRIYKVDPTNNSHTTLVSNTAGTPNGIVWDPVGDRLVVVFWGANAKIKGFDRNTGAPTALFVNTGVTNIDGVTIDCLGNFLVASWSPARITRYAPDFIAAGVDVGVAGLNNPADIDFDLVHNRICIPNAGNSTVVLHDLDCSLGVSETATSTSTVIRALPNPSEDVIRFDPPFTRTEPYVLLDARGLLIGGGTVAANAHLDVSKLVSGSYVIQFTRIGALVRIVRK